MKILWGPDSMVPQPQDAIDIYRNILWFVGRGPKPQFDRWTYWEKFDYWAVFWGMAIIGGSGLLLWFPVFFSKLLPGWMFNIAALVHGEEALLARRLHLHFHFFQRPRASAKFPMDTVVFTGRISEHELKDERATELRTVGSARPAGGQARARTHAGIEGVRLVRWWRSACARHCRDRIDRLQFVLVAGCWGDRSAQRPPARGCWPGDSTGREGPFVYCGRGTQCIANPGREAGRATTVGDPQ